MSKKTKKKNTTSCQGKTSTVKLSEFTEITCPRCGCKSRASEYDEITYSRCTTRERRRDFSSITNIKSWKSVGLYYYECPKCNMISMCNELILDNTNESLKKYSGKPINKNIGYIFED